MAPRRRPPKEPPETARPVAAPFPAAWDLRPAHLPTMSEDAWRAACVEADYLGWELTRHEDATRRELEAIGYPTKEEDLERIYFRDQREAPRDRRERRKWVRGHRAFVALINLRDVRHDVAARHLYSAVVHALYAGVGGGILDAAEMGARTRAAASSGGKALAEGRRSEAAHQYKQWQQQAEELWRRHSDWSTSRVARAVADTSSASWDVVRRHIRKP